MTDREKRYVKRAIGPDGRILTLADLPSPDTTRWVARRKAEIVASVHAGLIDKREACERYAITDEEFLEWVRAYSTAGLPGLQMRAKRKRNFSSETDLSRVRT